MNLFSAGVLASLIAGLATFVGALPILGVRKLSQGAIALLLGLGGGVMLAATAFSLIIPGTEAAIALGYSQFQAALMMATGLALGGIFLSLAHLLPHEHFIKGSEGKSPRQLAKIWLFIIAITLHNFPEGLAVGVSFGGESFAGGISTALGIGLQNMPEGLVVAVSLVSAKYSVNYALGITLLTGLVEPLGGIVGATVVTTAENILPWAMAFAAGAMLFVICDEIIPESHQPGTERQGTMGTMAGFILMMLLDISLG